MAHMTLGTLIWFEMLLSPGVSRASRLETAEEMETLVEFISELQC